jgi:hypothetical protein
MIIIELAPLKNGAHRNQTTSGLLPVPNGWAVIPKEMALPETFPFVGVEAQAGIVTALTPGTVPKPESESIPTMDERMEKLENENKLLKEQISAQANQAEFYEDCIAEMAEIVYA